MIRALPVHTRIRLAVAALCIVAMGVLVLAGDDGGRTQSLRVKDGTPPAAIQPARAAPPIVGAPPFADTLPVGSDRRHGTR